MSSIKYRPEIDGLRAIAIIPVILFHMGFEGIAGGFMGVDVFFVISGYLITLIILKDYDSGNFTFPRFWLRRVRRIFPALIAMVIGTSVIGYFVLFGSEVNDLGIQGVSTVLSFANVSMWKLAGNYWGTKAENSPFLHAWSLSVEEQFYFFFPFIIYLLLRFKKDKVLTTLLIIAISSFLLYLYGSKHYPYASFYFLPTRAWELASGCLLAIITWKYSFKISNTASLFLPSVGLAIIFLSYAFISGQEGFHGYLIVPVVGSVLIIAFSENKNSIINRLLSLPPIVYIGKISYSLYLWHWPVLVLAKKARSEEINNLPTLVLLVVIIALSITSYHLVEKTTRDRVKVIPIIFFAFIVSLSISLFLYTKNYYYNTSMYGKVVWSGQPYNVNPHDTWDESVQELRKDIIVPNRGIFSNDAYYTGGIIKQYGAPKPEVVVLGDSHGLMWSNVINMVAKELNLTISFYATEGVSPFITLPLNIPAKPDFFTPEEKYLFDKKRLEFLKEWKPKIVIIGAKWDNTNNQSPEDLIQFLQELGSKIILIEQPPEMFFPDKSTPQYLAYKGIIPKDNQKTYVKIPNNLIYKYNHGKDLVQRLCVKYPNCSYIPVGDIFYKENEGALVLDGTKVLYVDDDHLSEDGALKIKNRLKEKIVETITPKM